MYYSIIALRGWWQWLQEYIIALSLQPITRVLHWTDWLYTDWSEEYYEL